MLLLLSKVVILIRAWCLYNVTALPSYRRTAYLSSTRGRLGFDGFDEGIAACPGPGSWLNRLE